MDKVYIGQRVSEFSPGLETLPISKVELLNESGDIVGVAGNDTGRVLTAENPDGTNAMAADVLAAVGGFVYKPYESDGALIDPAAELGDGVTVGGVYSVLANENISFDSLYSADISAPTTDEIEGEYPYLTESQRIKRAVAGTRSLIAKTAEEIRLEVSGKIGRDDASAMIEMAIKGITMSVSSKDGSTTFTLTGAGTTLSTKTLDLTVDAVNISGLLTASQIDVTDLKVNAANVTGSITFGQLASDVQNDINDAYTMAYYASMDAEDAIDTVSAWTYSGSTYIDGSMIMTGTVMASYLLGGYVGLMTSGEQEIGGLSIAYTSTGYGLEIYTDYGGIKLTSGGNVFITSAYNTRLQLDSAGAYIGPDLYLTNGTQITSDRNLKHDIEYDIAAYDALFDALKPTRFKYNDGTSDRYHVGMIAQDVKDAVLAAGLTAQDFAAYCERPVYALDEEGNPTAEVTGYTCALRYDEFIALNIWQIQKLKARVAELEAKL